MGKKNSLRNELDLTVAEMSDNHEGAVNQFFTEKYYIETVHERIGVHVLSSSVREATSEEVESAKAKFLKGECDHSIIEDEAGWLYDYRSCRFCGKGLGTV